MPRCILASTKPLKYGKEFLSKSLESLRRLAGKSIPLVDGHEGARVGAATDLRIEKVGGTHVLTGVVPSHHARGKGLSLRYKAAMIGDGMIDIAELIHAAFVDNPRDSTTMFADGDSDLIIFSDSEDTPPDPPVDQPTGTEPPVGTPAAEPQSYEMELTPEVITAVIDRITQSGELEKLIDAAIAARSPDPKLEDKPPAPAPKIVVKPRPVEVAPAKPKAKPLPIQQPFRSA